jgi:hypothetical protein
MELKKLIRRVCNLHMQKHVQPWYPRPREALRSSFVEAGATMTVIISPVYNMA